MELTDKGEMTLKSLFSEIIVDNTSNLGKYTNIKCMLLETKIGSDKTLVHPGL